MLSHHLFSAEESSIKDACSADENSVMGPLHEYRRIQTKVNRLTMRSIEKTKQEAAALIRGTNG